VDVTTTPQALLRVAPLRRVDAGGVASFDASPAELSSIQGPTCALQRRRRHPVPKHGSFAPTEISPDTSCHELMSTPAGEAGAELMGQSPHELAGGQHRAIRTRAAVPDLPRRGSRFAHPRCLPSMGSPEGAGSATPQIVTNLWSSRVRRLFYRRENLKALTCLGNRSTRRPGHSPKRSR
jgi:hypothetical protein